MSANRIDELFKQKKSGILSIYFTAGFPQLTDTLTILQSLEEAGVDMVELGIPFSDPLADGPVIQASGKKALENGMTLALLFEQLKNFRQTIHLPVLLMGYLNPVMQYGMENFLSRCREVGIDGVILPDLPLQEFEQHYQDLFEAYGIYFIFLITPETTEDRIRRIDSVSRGFVYLVSTSSTTGSERDLQGREGYFQQVEQMQLIHPILVGFGIRTRRDFDLASSHVQGAIIGTAFIQALESGGDTGEAIHQFMRPFQSR
ncbi:MAG: tryptophan synthase subunit alpha [Chitinophagaceae bacterium]